MLQNPTSLGFCVCVWVSLNAFFKKKFDFIPLYSAAPEHSLAFEVVL